MDKAIASALFKAAGDRDCVVMMNDAARLNTKPNEGCVILNDSKGILTAIRPNDEVSSFISSPIEVFTTEYENITSISICGDYNKTVTVLQNMKAGGLLTEAQYNQCIQAIITSDMVYTKDASTSLENTSETKGYKSSIRNVSNYGSRDREPMKEGETYKSTRDWNQPEIVVIPNKDKKKE